MDGLKLERIISGREEREGYNGHFIVLVQCLRLSNLRTQRYFRYVYICRLTVLTIKRRVCVTLTFPLKLGNFWGNILPICKEIKKQKLYLLSGKSAIKPKTKLTNLVNHIICKQSSEPKTRNLGRRGARSVQETHDCRWSKVCFWLVKRLTQK